MSYVPESFHLKTAGPNFASVSLGRVVWIREDGSRVVGSPSILTPRIRNKLSPTEKREVTDESIFIARCEKDAYFKVFEQSDFADYGPDGGWFLIWPSEELEEIQKSMVPCAVCKILTDNSHRCITCRRPVHGCCGLAVGEEGYGQQRLCVECDQSPSGSAPFVSGDHN